MLLISDAGNYESTEGTVETTHPFRLLDEYTATL